MPEILAPFHALSLESRGAERWDIYEFQPPNSDMVLEITYKQFQALSDLYSLVDPTSRAATLMITGRADTLPTTPPKIERLKARFWQWLSGPFGYLFYYSLGAVAGFGVGLCW